VELKFPITIKFNSIGLVNEAFDQPQLRLFTAYPFLRTDAVGIAFVDSFRVTNERTNERTTRFKLCLAGS
jgi:hypothetical protein